MGLDVVAYSEAEIVPEHCFGVTNDGYPVKYCPDNTDHIMTSGIHMQSTLGVIPGTCYDVSGSEHPYHMRAGSYSSYGDWRNDLSETMLGISAAEVWENQDAYSRKPFYELINFSDCDGVIGFIAAQNLLQDFLDNHDKYIELHSNDQDINHDDQEWNIMKYEEWTNIFRTASEGGLVLFC